MSIKGKLSVWVFAWFFIFSTNSIAFLRSHHKLIHSVPYSNVIIFGDSQSDIGNGPESLTYYEPNTTTSTKIATTLYVPISNPVNTKVDKILPSVNISFPPAHLRSKRFKLTLPTPLPICADGICYSRKYRSLNWTEYFFYNGFKNGLFSSPADLRPWVIQYGQKSKPIIAQSVNYAWYSAMSNSQCQHFTYSVSPCTVNKLSLNASVYQRQHQYRKNQSKVDSRKNAQLRYQMIIPSLQKQIEMFKNDLRSHKVIVNPNTLYIVWTGANDIGFAFEQYGRKEISSDALEYQLKINLPNLIAGSDSRSIVNQLIKLGAQHIVILGQYNLGLTPEALKKRHLGFVKRAVIQKVNRFIMLYNDSLKSLITKNFNATSIKYVDLQTPINQLVFNYGPKSPYAQTLGETCDTVVSQEDLKKGSAVSCYNNNYSPVGWWNEAHLSTQLNQLIAATVLDTISSN